MPVDDVSRETSEQLRKYEALVRKWSPRVQLVSAGDLPHLRGRHLRDSMQLAAHVPDGARYVDLGSGGGFPGIVVAIRRGAATLVEADQRKAAFLRTCGRELDLDLTVIAGRIEAVEPLCADILSARALAPLRLLLAYARRHLAPGGRCLFPKGVTWRDEVAEALAEWRFDLHTYPSETQDGAAILDISNIEWRGTDAEGR